MAGNDDIVAMLKAEVERLKQDVKAARAETSAVAKVLAFEPPYQASPAKRVEALVHWKEVNGSEIARLKAEVDRKDAALAGLVDACDAIQEDGRMIVDPHALQEARAALTAKGGENAKT
jgi:uncharacterized small protein (DUF1192 family)